MSELNCTQKDAYMALNTSEFPSLVEDADTAEESAKLACDGLREDW